MENLLNKEREENESKIKRELSGKKPQILANPRFLKLAKGQLKDITYDVIKNFRYFEFTDLNDFNNRNYYIFQRESDNSTNYMLTNSTKSHPHKLNSDGTHTEIQPLSPEEVKEMNIVKAKIQAHPDDDSLIDWSKFASDNYIKCKDFKSWLAANPLGSTAEYEAYKKANKDGQFCINLFHAKPNVCQDKINTVSNDKEAELNKLRAEIERLTVENRTLKGQNQTLTIEITTLKGENQALKGENKGLLDERDAIKVSLQEEDDLLAQLRTELASCKTSVKIDQLFTNIDSQREKKKGIFTKLKQVFSTKKGGYYEKYLKYKGKYLAAKQ